MQLAHGEYPLPAPAAAYLPEGTATRAPGYVAENVTPMGAALPAEFAGGRPFSGELVPGRVGYGAAGRAGAAGGPLPAEPWSDSRAEIENETREGSDPC